MEKLKRIIIFWTLALLFLIVAPSVVMYARGYLFDFSRGVFVHSGTITFKTNPQDIDLSINGKTETSKQLNRINNSFNISGLIPRNYEIQASAPGFQAWSKKTDVHSGLASEFWNVLLVRNEYERDNYATGGIEKFFISPKNDYLIYTQPNDAGISAKIAGIKNKKIEAEFDFSGWQFVPDERKENIEWSPEEDYLSIPLKKIPEKNKTGAKTNIINSKEGQDIYAYFIADPSQKTVFNFNEFIGKDSVKDIRWDPIDKNYLFFLSEDSLYRSSIQDKNDLTLVFDNVSGFDLSKAGLYFSKMPNNLVYKTDLKGTGEKNQLTNLFPELPDSPVEKMIVYDDDRIALLDRNKNFFIYNHGELDTYFKKLSSNVEGMHFSDDGKKIIYWTKNELSVYFLRQWNVQPLRIENEIQNITRYSEELKNVQWFKDYEHIIFSAGSQIKVIELDSRDHRNCMDLPKTASDKPFVIYSSYLEKLFFTDQAETGLDLYSITFPERLPILGIF